MGKLDNIPKKEVFDVPDGFFEELPGIIQARVAPSKPVRQPYSAGAFALRFIAPVVVIFAVAFFVFRSSSKDISAEDILADVSSEDLVAYLNESDLKTDELIELIDFNEYDVQDLEDEVMMTSPDDLNAIVDEIDLKLDL